MSPLVAFFIITWVAIVVLFFGLGAVLREVRLLRGTVLRNPDGFAAGQPDLSLGASFAGGPEGGGGQRIVLAADSGCPLCRQVTDRLAGRGVAATILTHEPATAWPDLPGRLRLVSDREAWRAVSHLSPPVLMLVDGAGQVRRLALPVRVDDVDGVLDEWTELIREDSVDAADVRADS